MTLLKLSLRPWFQAFWTQILCALAVGILLFLGAVFGALSLGLEPVLVRAESQELLTVVLDSTQNLDQEKKTLDDIRTTLGSAPQAVFTGPQDFIERLGKQDPDLVHEILQLGENAMSVVPRFVTITGFSSKSESIADKRLDLKAIAGVESVEDSKSQFIHIAQVLRNLQWGARALGLGVVLTLFCLLIVLARLNEQFFVGSLRVLKLWGAPYWVLILPAILSMLSVGLLGGGAAYLAWRGLGPEAIAQFQSFSPLLSEIEIQWIAMANSILGFSFLFSLASGWLGARTRQ
jgi:cell division protein FtsX